jgi:hypothetical protein
LWFAALSGTGLVIVLIPDTDVRVFSLSEGHGPSLLDGVGVLLLIAGWVVLDLATWRRRREVSYRRGVVVMVTLAAIAASAVVLWSVLGDHGAWWVLGAAVLAAIQLCAAA